MLYLMIEEPLHTVALGVKAHRHEAEKSRPAFLASNYLQHTLQPVPIPALPYIYIHIAMSAVWAAGLCG